MRGVAPLRALCWWVDPPDVSGAVSGMSGRFFSKVGPVDWPGSGTVAAASWAPPAAAGEGETFAPGTGVTEETGDVSGAGTAAAAGVGAVDGDGDWASTRIEAKAAARRTRSLFIGTKAGRYCEEDHLKSETRWMDAVKRGEMSPWEVARRLAHLPGLVFLDSSLSRPGAVSRIAACPEEIIEGDEPEDWARLRYALKRRAGQPGMAAGYVEYEGRFRFGLYERVLTYFHDDAHWLDEGGLAAMMADVDRTDDMPISFRPEMERTVYESIVRRAQEYIASGDIYQVNLAHRFSGVWSGGMGQALGFYDRLREFSPAPCAALVCAEDRVIASSSPELFLQMGGRDIVTRPIKGTRARSGDAAADAAAARELEASSKERAELVMITDLERNDLGQVCEYGTVEVRALLKLEPYAQVHHLVSTVAGRLRNDVDHIAALQACFPGGSVTGAPKKRAREIIAELEPARRGVYTGAIGCVRFDGHSTFNIAIRTAVLERSGKARFHVGAGIVADSDPRKEWEETLWKAAGLLRAADQACGQARKAC